jgi:hypothetical protein
LYQTYFTHWDNNIWTIIFETTEEAKVHNNHFELAEFSGITVSHQVFVKPKN